MLTYLPGNAQHIGARGEQQDAFGFSDPGDAKFVAHGGLLGILADGMGGLEGGRQASAAAVSAFMDAYARKTSAEQIPHALTRSLHEANGAVLAVAHRLGTKGGTGTTLAAMILHRDSLYWISAGDSRLYALRNGRLAQLNGDHCFATDLWADVSANRIDRQEALANPQASHLTSYLGLPELPHIDLSMRAFPLQAGDVIIACSDGIYRSLTGEEIARFLLFDAPGAACEAIKAATLAKAKKHQDNLTVIAVRCEDASMPVAAPMTRVTQPRRRILATAALCAEVLVAGGLVARSIKNHAVAGHNGRSGQTKIAPTDHKTLPTDADPPAQVTPATAGAPSTPAVPATPTPKAPSATSPKIAPRPQANPSVAPDPSKAPVNIVDVHTQAAPKRADQSSTTRPEGQATQTTGLGPGQGTGQGEGHDVAPSDANQAPEQEKHVPAQPLPAKQQNQPNARSLQNHPQELPPTVPAKKPTKPLKRDGDTP